MNCGVFKLHLGFEGVFPGLVKYCEWFSEFKIFPRFDFYSARKGFCLDMSFFLMLVGILLTKRYHWVFIHGTNAVRCGRRRWRVWRYWALRSSWNWVIMALVPWSLPAGGVELEAKRVELEALLWTTPFLVGVYKGSDNMLKRYLEVFEMLTIWGLRERTLFWRRWS